MQSTRTRPKSRLICVVALSAPLFFSWVTAKIRSWGWNAMEAGWVPWAHLILGLIALYLLVTPFVIAFRFRKTENRNTENNFEHLALLMGGGGATAVAGLAFLLVAFGGGSMSAMYAWASVSLAAALFWSWKYRRLLR